MFSIIAYIFRQLFSKPLKKCLILGLDNGGKTTTLQLMRSEINHNWNGEVGHTLPTVGLNMARFQYKRQEVCFWDLGGQTALRSLWSKYYDEAHGILYVIDANDPDRLTEALGELEKAAAQFVTPIKVCVFLNKCDVAADVGPLTAQLDAWCAQHLKHPYAVLYGSAMRPRIIRGAPTTAAELIECLLTLHQTNTIKSI
ncbi:ADP-ribosylation factor family protein [Gregarina niphandrodes]|uniref:ADP-ribosylation factor family protein n=1 Tax=Gregarina niphandrodes TaxID=110365 RepID=A0A023B6Z5_GRENI|nr:ADP-ribosylation factor family protein [Gregarina niphandrodes]EZG66905.1 ADP-ribosylation factor family protein [Gregarina niphandrodes]|eukprot:XP_011130438.1 ADP-ribosylation factor family protein [Gregarina niphandrodes]